MRLDAIVFLLAFAVGTLGAQEAAPATPPAPTAPAPAPTPRQAYQKAEALFAQGHVFTAEEQTALLALRASLVDSGDADLAANLDLLRLGSADAALSAAARAKAVAALDHDTELWADREKPLQDRAFWRGVRDGGLFVFTASTIATLLIAATSDRDQAYMHNSYDSNGADRKAFADGMNWALLGSASTMFLSLFPILWGEARQ